MAFIGKVRGVDGSRQGSELSGKRLTARLTAKVRAREDLGPYVRMQLDVPGWRPAAAGQFAMLQPAATRCFLPRAYSISDEVQGRDGRYCVTFLIAPVGEGSRELAALHRGDVVHVLGPLGKGFRAAGCTWPGTKACQGEVGPAGGRLVIVTGGVGIAPVPLLLRQLKPQLGAEDGYEILILLGFRSALETFAADAVLSQAAGLRALGVATLVDVTTDDGSYGTRGLVTAQAARRLAPGDVVVACGPEGMLRALWPVCEKAGVAEVWMSMEATMACGVGSCHGCVIGDARGRYVRVCREGPVFRASALFGAGG